MVKIKINYDHLENCENTSLHFDVLLCCYSDERTRHECEEGMICFLFVEIGSV